jgi:hypothetical protein
VVGGLLIGPLLLLVVVPPLCLVFLDRRAGGDLSIPRGESPSTTPGPEAGNPNGADP